MYREKLKQLFEEWSGTKVINFIDLPLSGSDRKYFRISNKNISVIGVYNKDKKENRAFIQFTNHFQRKGLNVPAIYADKQDEDIYLLQDLGNTTLFSYLTMEKRNNDFSYNLKNVYKKVLKELPKFQIVAGKDLNYVYSYPRDRFDKQSMMWDLNYFKYYFLKLAQIPFDEQQIEDDFKTFTDYLLEADCNYFLYRDFQSRNIMLKNNQVYFIDYQGGRRGALQYDLASLLYDAKANIPQDVRIELLNYYLEVLSDFIDVDKETFKKYYYAYVLIRIMQAMGTYGFRGFYEKKEHFLKSIPYVLVNLEWILKNVQLPIKIKHLWEVLHQLIQSERLKEISVNFTKLKVSINSFSYKRGVPIDESGNGGGFVFDCRALPNPGRYEEYKKMNGKNDAVIQYFEKTNEVDSFLQNIHKIIDQSVEKYIEREFTHLTINFGCTGGQHRSVYCAEKLAEYLQKKYPIDINIRHREEEIRQ